MRTKFRIKYFFFLLPVIFLTTCSPSPKERLIPIEQFFNEPQNNFFEISPDGSSISFLQPFQNKLNLFVMDADGSNVRRLTSETDRNIQYYFWADNNELLFLKDRVPGQIPHLYSVKKDGTGLINILPAGKFRIRLINSDHITDNELLVAMNLTDSTKFDVYRINLKNRKLTLASKNPGTIRDWFADNEGKLRVAIASDGVNETLLYRDDESQNFRPLVVNNFKTMVRPVGFNGEDGCLYALSNQGRDKTALVEIDTRTGKEHKVLYSHPDVDVTDASYSFTKKKITYVIAETWKKERKYLDTAVQRRYEFLESKIPNSEIRITSRNDDESKFVIRTFTDRNPGSYYLFNESGKTLKKLADVNTSLSEAEMTEMKPVSYKSRDGLTINGYLTLPLNAGKSNLPVVIMPHGGPSYRSSWGFNPDVQFLANRGYAVFQMNYRGSTGYGKNFWSAGFKEWGGDIQNDITDGVKWLIDTKVADPKRIAIFGSNFGGYCALYGLCFEPGLYRCGISVSGVTNLFTYLKGIPPYFKPYQKMFFETVGDPVKDADYFRSVSPVFHTDKIKSPLLIVQGGKDPRSSVSETNQFVKELKKRGGDVTYILKEEEGHLFKSQENKLAIYRELEQFLNNNMKK